MIALTTIRLNNALDVEIDADMLDFAMRNVARHVYPGRTESIDVYIDKRRDDGWLEWGMNIVYPDGGKLFLGLIQRELGAPFESHS